MPSITARPSPDEKTRFKLLARHVGLSESTLALRAIRILLDHDEKWSRARPKVDLRHTAASDRLTIRLRPGDGIEVIRRATERGIKPATYVSALVATSSKSLASIAARSIAGSVPAHSRQSAPAVDGDGFVQTSNAG